jgi:hypothetical protein
MVPQHVCLRRGRVWGICATNRSDEKAIPMDYGKSGNPKLGKHEPQNKEGDKGPKKPVKPARPSKDELLARMKAAVAKK